MSNLSDCIGIILTISSLLGAAYTFTYTRKTFIFSVCKERAKEVKSYWNSNPRYDTMDIVREEYRDQWSGVISEIVSSIVIIDKLSDKYIIMRYLFTVDDFYTIFWQQIPTDLRTAIEKYKETLQEPLDEHQIIFRNQMRDILKTYKK
jgi:hypothetical protein